jgi:hypothetical protein
MGSKKEVADALREYTKMLWEQIHGAYGRGYEGELEREIQALAQAILRLSEADHSPHNAAATTPKGE